MPSTEKFVVARFFTYSIGEEDRRHRIYDLSHGLDPKWGELLIVRNRHLLHRTRRRPNDERLISELFEPLVHGDGFICQLGYLHNGTRGQIDLWLEPEAPLTNPRLWDSIDDDVVDFYRAYHGWEAHVEIIKR